MPAVGEINLSFFLTVYAFSVVTGTLASILFSILTLQSGVSAVFFFSSPHSLSPLCVSRGLQRWFGHAVRRNAWNRAMAEFGNGLADESLLDSDPGHPELEDPGVGDEEPGLEEGEAAIEDPVSEGHCFICESKRECVNGLCPYWGGY